MKLLLTLCCTALLLTAETKQERGRRILDEAIAALGGEAFLNVRNRVETGRAYSFYREQLTGLARATISTKYTSPSEKGISQRERQSFGKKEEEYAVLFLEKGAYQVSFRGAKTLKADRYDRYVDTVRRNIFYLLRQRLKEPGLIVESEGTSVWQNTPVEILQLTDANNDAVQVYFHRTTKLPVRQVFYRRDPETKERIEEVQIFSKYRDVGAGVQWPFAIVSQRNGDKSSNSPNRSKSIGTCLRAYSNFPGA
ncbi:MAG: hypothetical protein WKF37_21855 [Bryobacteraceae bacterium]